MSSFVCTQAIGLLVRAIASVTSQKFAGRLLIRANVAEDIHRWTCRRCKSPQRTAVRRLERKHYVLHTYIIFIYIECIVCGDHLGARRLAVFTCPCPQLEAGRPAKAPASNPEFEAARLWAAASPTLPANRRLCQHHDHAYNLPTLNTAGLNDLALILHLPPSHHDHSWALLLSTRPLSLCLPSSPWSARCSPTTNCSQDSTRRTHHSHRWFDK